MDLSHSDPKKTALYTHFSRYIQHEYECVFMMYEKGRKRDQKKNRKHISNLNFFKFDNWQLTKCYRRTEYYENFEIPN